MRTLCMNCYAEIDEVAMHYKCTSCGKFIHKQCAIKHEDKPYCDLCYTARRHKKEVIVLPDVIRRSYIETYKSCPYKFYLEVVKGHEQPKNIYTELGIDVHTLMDKMSDTYQKYTVTHFLDEFDNLFKDYPDEWFDSEEQKDKMYERGMNSIRTGWEIIPYLPPAFSKEEKIIFDVGEGLPKISCTSDRTHMVNHELEVIDWKTGKVLVGAKHETDLQAPLYIYSVIEKYKRPVRKFTFYYLDENKTRIFNHIRDDEYECEVGKRSYQIKLSKAIDETKKILTNIMDHKFNIPTESKSMFFTCKMCHLRHEGLCKGADIQTWTNKGEFDWNS